MLILWVPLGVKTRVQPRKHALLLANTSTWTLPLNATGVGGSDTQIHLLKGDVIFAVVGPVVVVDHGYLDRLVAILGVRTVPDSDVALSLLSCTSWVLPALLFRVCYGGCLTGWRLLHHACEETKA